jgi:hypothetical protein
MQEIGNIGELIGGIGVVLSFLFLAWQIRQNSKMIRAQIRQSFADNAVNGTMAISTNPDLRRVISKINSGDKLTEDEHIVWGGYIYANLWLWQNQFIQFQMGTLPSIDWEVQTKLIVNSELFRKWLELNWESLRSIFNPEFSAEIDRVLRDNPLETVQFKKFARSNS